MSSILLTVSAGAGEIRPFGAFAFRLDTILPVQRCQWKEVLFVISNRKEVLSFLTSHCKEVLVPL